MHHLPPTHLCYLEGSLFLNPKITIYSGCFPHLHSSFLHSNHLSKSRLYPSPHTATSNDEGPFSEMCVCVCVCVCVRERERERGEYSILLALAPISLMFCLSLPTSLEARDL